jgi:glycosyl transferase family 25
MAAHAPSRKVGESGRQLESYVEGYAVMGLLDYFDRLAIIHLPDRDDRLRALTKELRACGIDINDPKVVIPHAPMPASANGFRSRGVYGSFLSHLEILEAAHKDGLETVWTIEDDAIFSKRFRLQQERIASYLRENEWDLCFIGHSGGVDGKGIPKSPTGLLRYSGPFIWAHNYAVHRRILPRLIEFVRTSSEREEGHPEGGKIYIDAAYFFFRQFNPDVVSIVSSPCLSVQKGSESSLNARKIQDRIVGIRSLANVAREIRDEYWRRGWLRIHGPQDVLSDSFKVTSPPAQVWPTTANVGTDAGTSAKSW